MRHVLSYFVIVIILCQVLAAQDKLYLTFSFMKVDHEQYTAYRDIEDFWSKIHQQAANNGDIIGWDLWSLKPGGEQQGYQFVIVILYDDPVTMMKGGTWPGLLANAKKAYPQMSEEELKTEIMNSLKTREFSEQIFMERLAHTDSEFKIKPGIIASFDLMKAEKGKTNEYEKAEIEIFQPNHQKMINAGAKGSWGLLRVMLPMGSKRFYSHMTVNMYSDYGQFFKSRQFDFGELTEEQKHAMQDGLDARDMKWVYMARLEKIVRKEE